jgi:3-polyprenyl-4-hydroxybenzoate decarboxylase
VWRISSGPADILDHATSECAIGSKLAIDATKKLPGTEAGKRSVFNVRLPDTVVEPGKGWARMTNKE